MRRSSVTRLDGSGSCSRRKPSRIWRGIRRASQERSAGPDRPAAVDALGHVGVRREGGEVPAPVRDLGPEGGAPAPERAVAEHLQPGGRARPAERADALGHQRPAHHERVVHQVAADLVGAVGGARHEQQLGVLDRVPGQHEELGGHALRRRGRAPVVVGDVLQRAHAPAVGREHDAGDDHLRADLDGAALRAAQRLERVVLRLRGTDRDAARVPLAAQAAVRVADGADGLVAAPVVVGGVGDAVACLRRVADDDRDVLAVQVHGHAVEQLARTAGRCSSAGCGASGRRSPPGTGARGTPGRPRRPRRRAPAPRARSRAPARRSRAASRRRRRSARPSRSRPGASAGRCRASASSCRPPSAGSRSRTAAGPPGRSSRRRRVGRPGRAARCRAPTGTARPRWARTASWAPSPGPPGSGRRWPGSRPTSARPRARPPARARCGRPRRAPRRRARPPAPRP